MDHRGGVHRVAVPFGRQETDCLGGDHGVLIEAMAESVHHANDMDLSGGAEDNLELYFAFDFELASFFGVGWPRFLQNLGRDSRSRELGACAGRRGGCRYRIAKAAAANLAASAGGRGGHAALTKTSRGDRTPRYP